MPPLKTTLETYFETKITFTDPSNMKYIYKIAYWWPDIEFQKIAKS